MAAAELPVSLREREEGRERGGERERSEPGSVIELRAWALLSWVSHLYERGKKETSDPGPSPLALPSWILAAHDYQDVLGTAHD